MSDRSEGPDDRAASFSQRMGHAMIFRSTLESCSCPAITSTPNDSDRDTGSHSRFPGHSHYAGLPGRPQPTATLSLSRRLACAGVCAEIRAHWGRSGDLRDFQLLPVVPDENGLGVRVKEVAQLGPVQTQRASKLQMQSTTGFVRASLTFHRLPPRHRAAP